MTAEAKAILSVFREKRLRSGGFVHFTDFGDAIIWKAGFIRDEPVRTALEWLVAGEYVVELNSGLALTKRGENLLYSEAT